MPSKYQLLQHHNEKNPRKIYIKKKNLLTKNHQKINSLKQQQIKLNYHVDLQEEEESYTKKVNNYKT